MKHKKVNSFSTGSNTDAYDEEFQTYLEEHPGFEDKLWAGEEYWHPRDSYKNPTKEEIDAAFLDSKDPHTVRWAHPKNSEDLYIFPSDIQHYEMGNVIDDPADDWDWGDEPYINGVIHDKSPHEKWDQYFKWPANHPDKYPRRAEEKRDLEEFLNSLPTRPKKDPYSDEDYRGLSDEERKAIDEEYDTAMQPYYDKHMKNYDKIRDLARAYAQSLQNKPAPVRNNDYSGAMKDLLAPRKEKFTVDKNKYPAKNPLDIMNETMLERPNIHGDAKGKDAGKLSSTPVSNRDYAEAMRKLLYGE